MSTAVIVYVLTALAGLVVVLTRVRLGKDEGAGRLSIGRTLLNVHTGSGLLAGLTWIPFLAFDEESFFGDSLVGIIGLAFGWITTFAGLAILLRWLPSRGRHSAGAKEDTWSEGPGLSILAHVGLLVGICVMTWAYLTSKV